MAGLDLTNNTTVYEASDAAQYHEAAAPYSTLHVRTSTGLLVAIDQAPTEDSFLLAGNSTCIFHVEPNERLYFRSATPGSTGDIRISAIAASATGAEMTVPVISTGDLNIDTSLLATAAKQTTQQTALDAIQAAVEGTLDVSASLDTTGLATDAGQATGNASLDAIDTKLGGTLAVSGPLTDAQLTSAALATSAKQDSAKTTLDAIDTKLGGTIAVSGPLTAAQLTTAALATSAKQDTAKAVLDAIAASTAAADSKLGGTLAVSGPLTDAQLTTAALATAAKQDLSKAVLDQIYNKLADTVAVTGPLTAAQLTTAALATSAKQDTAQTALAAIQAAVEGTLTVSATLDPTGLATDTAQATGNASLDAIDTKLGGTLAVSAASLPLPSGAATSAKQDTLAGLVGEVQASPTANTLLDRLKSIATALAGTLAISASALPLPTGAATSANQDTLAGLVGEVQTTPTANTMLDRLKAIATALAGTLTMQPSADQDPKYDHSAGTKYTSSVTSGTVITPAAGVKYIRIWCSVDTLVRTDGTAAADDGGSIFCAANVSETIPVVPSTAVTAITLTGAGVVRATPMITR